VWARALAVVLAAAALPLACSSKSGDDDSAGCTKDTDCRGGRICELGACVDDPASSGGSGASGGTGSGTGGSTSGASGSAGKGGSGTGGSAGAGQLYGWRVDDSLVASFDIQGLWGARSNEIWAVAGGGDLLGGEGQLHHWDGSQWELYYSMGTPSFSDIWGVNGGASVFFVGYGPQFYELDATSISALELQSGGSTVPNDAVWASAPDAVWVGSNSTSQPLRLWTGASFSQESKYRSPDTSGVTAIWGSGANDVWASDADGILHFDGQGWTPSYTGSSNFSGIQGTGASDVWAVSPRHVVHFDGTSWKEQTAASGQAINAVWVAGPNDVWLVGDGGRILHGGTAGFTPVESGITEGLFAVWGVSSTDIWAGGEDGVLIHYGPVSEPTEPPDGGTTDCSPQGYGCSMTPCCSPWRCANIGSNILVCE
jgi:hypothetical protein